MTAAPGEVGLVLAQLHEVEVREGLAQQGLGVEVRRQRRPARAVVELRSGATPTF